MIADDHHLVRQGIRALLEKAGDIEVVGEADDGQEALKIIQDVSPDVAVLDIAMPRLNGTQVLQKMQSFHMATRAVVLTMYSDEALIRQALRFGACGFLLKKSVTEELLLAIRAASRGETFLSTTINGFELSLEHPDNPSGSGANSLFEILSPREVEVLQLVAEGFTNQATALQLKVSVKTVEKHRASLMEKLHVHDTASLVRVAIRQGLIFLDDVPEIH
jgi:DNA-binding NarL/FixJ family response regulator